MVELQTVIDEINTGKIEFDYKDDDCCTTEGEVVILLKRLAELEKSDVEVVRHGEWRCDYDEDYGETKVTCSVCGDFRYINGCWVGVHDEPLYDEDIFCPHCGAKMDGREFRRNEI